MQETCKNCADLADARAAAAAQAMREALRDALAWIDAVPSDMPLPAMPGFDRDAVDELMATPPDTAALDRLIAELVREAVEVERGRWQKNSRETWEAMVAMRNAINEHIPMPSLESDLLQGPESSVFCAAVAEAIIASHVNLTKAHDTVCGALAVAVQKPEQEREECAKIADAYAAENFRMATDSVLLDRMQDFRETEERQAEGNGHSSAGITARNIAAAIRARGSKEGGPTIPDEQRIRQDERTAIAAYIGMSPSEVTDRQYHMEAIRTGRYRDDPLMQRGGWMEDQK